MKRIFALGVLALCLVLPVMANGQGEAGTDELIMASSNPPESLISKMGQKFADIVNESGVVKINLIVGQSLGDMNQVMEQHMEGSVDIAYDRPLWFGPFVQDFNVMSWGFTFENKAHMQTFFDSDVYKGLTDQVLEKTNVRILGSSVDLPRMLYTREPVQSIDDIQNLKMRVPRLESYVRLWEALGTKPTQVAWSEAFLSLKTGVVDGIEADIPGALVQRFHNAAPYITKTEHVMSGFFISINDQSWQNLDDAQKKVIEEASREALAWASEQSEKETAEALAVMVEEGAIVSEIDKAAFIEKSIKEVEAMEAAGVWSKGLWAEIQTLK